MPTDDQLKAIMPALPAAKRQTMLPFLQQAMAEFAIDNARREAAFLAQLAHESVQLVFMEEIWGPTAQQLKYEPVSTVAQGLGNTEVGDGKRFKGRGPIQLTGRSNYKKFSAELGVDLIADPTKAAAPDLAFRIAGLYWKRNGLNELADEATDAAFKTITRRINGGLTGLPDRQKFYVVARSVLGVTDLGAPVGPLVGGLPRAASGGIAPRGLRASRVLRTAAPLFERGAEAIARIDRASRARSRRARAAKKATGRVVKKSVVKKSTRRATSSKRAAQASKRKAVKRPRQSAKKR